MKKMNTVIAAVAVAMFSAGVNAAGTVVSENLATQQLTSISGVSHLSELVTSPNLPANIWWQGAVIATPAETRAVELQKSTLLARLKACALDASPAQQSTVQRVIDQIQSLRVAGRQFVSLDIDALRANKRSDWALEGDYQLYIKRRPATVDVLGAVSNPGPAYWQPATTVSHYLEGHDLLPGADRNTVTIIYPNGQTTVAPVAYWNERHREAEAGSVIWVGFDICKDRADAAPIQNDIISLLTRRIPN